MKNYLGSEFLRYQYFFFCVFSVRTRAEHSRHEPDREGAGSSGKVKHIIWIDNIYAHYCVYYKKNQTNNKPISLNYQNTLNNQSIHKVQERDNIF